jgi:putative NADH-flavin reductase
MSVKKQLKKIAVFGGSGATGRVLIRHALQRGIRVRTLVRNPSTLENCLEGAELITGSLANRDDVVNTLEGTDAVFCVFGPRPPYTDIFCEDVTKTIVAIMKINNINRLLCQTGGMIGDYPENRSIFFKLMIFLFRKRLPNIWLDRVGQESQVANSGLSWTIVKPPKLVDRPQTNKVVAGTDVKLGLLSSITRDDLSEFLIDEA